MINNFNDLEHLYLFKLIIKMGKKLSPNQISLIGFTATLFSLVFILNHLFLVAAFFVAVHLTCDGLDGYIARKYNKTSTFGFLLDHILDRLSDIIIFTSIGYSLNTPILGLLISMICLFSSYVGVLHKSIGQDQDKSGLFAKPYRYFSLILLLIIFSVMPGNQDVGYQYYAYLSLSIGGFTIITRLKSLLLSVKLKG